MHQKIFLENKYSLFREENTDGFLVCEYICIFYDHTWLSLFCKLWLQNVSHISNLLLNISPKERRYL